MEKKYIVGGLAVVGAIALFMYLKPKKKTNSDGFYNASGLKDFYKDDANQNNFYNTSSGSGTVKAYYKR